MYTFADRGGRSVTLRPEGTAGVVRAGHRARPRPRPAAGEARATPGRSSAYERPQAGRYRQFHQVGVEAIGIDDPALDAEVIAVADAGFRALGLTRLPAGARPRSATRSCRPAYREQLTAFLRELDAGRGDRERARLNPLRVLDDKRPEVRELLADAPLMVDHLCDECRAHYDGVSSGTSTTWASLRA